MQSKAVQFWLEASNVLKAKLVLLPAIRTELSVVSIRMGNVLFLQLSYRLFYLLPNSLYTYYRILYKFDRADYTTKGQHVHWMKWENGYKGGPVLGFDQGSTRNTSEGTLRSNCSISKLISMFHGTQVLAVSIKHCDTRRMF